MDTALAPDPRPSGDPVREVTVREVGLRDGLQNEAPIPLAAKLELARALTVTGLQRVEATAFMRADAIPALADAEQVWAGCTAMAPDVRWSALVANVRGAERALAAGARHLEFVVSASETHNRANVRRSRAESLASLSDVCRLVHDAGGDVQAIIATSFGCPYEGDIPIAEVVELAARARTVGADSLAFGDTTGVATPRRVHRLLDAILLDHRDIEVLLHLHDTRGLAMANLLAALDVGLTHIDASIGGLGGCPYAPGASGNIATEEVVHLLQDMGVETGIDLDALLEAATLAQRLVGRPLPSHLLQAGPRWRLTPLPEEVGS